MIDAQSDCEIKIYSINWQWLDYIMQYAALWTPHYYNKSTNKRELRSWVLNVVGFAFSILNIVLWLFYTAQDDQISGHFVNKFFLTALLTLTFFTLATSVRVFALYYLSMKFDYPWHQITLVINDKKQKNHMQNYVNKQAYYLNKRLKVYTILYYVIWIIHDGVISSAYYHTPRTWIDVLISIFGMFIPMCLFLHIYSVIAFKYECKLYYLQYLVSNKKTCTKEVPDFVLILDKYKLFYREFVKEQKTWIAFMSIFMSAAIVKSWMFVNFLLADYYDIYGKGPFERYVFATFGLIAWSIPVVQYITDASRINDKYDAFVELLWDCNDLKKANSSNHIHKQPMQITKPKRNSFDVELTESLLLEQTSSIQLQTVANVPDNIVNVAHNIVNVSDIDYHYLLLYIPSHAIVVKMLGWKLQKLTPIKMLFAFCVAKFVSYAIYYFY